MPSLNFLAKSRRDLAKPSDKRRVGIVGLVVDHNTNLGLVTPITATLRDNWHAAENLPFNASRIQRLLDEILKAYLEEWSLPEAYAFHFADTLKRELEGESMNFAAVLAAIDCVNKKPRIFDFAIAGIALEGDGTLSPVGSMKQKIDAFVREYGDLGTLLIRCADDNVAETYDLHFDQVWPVSTIEELADRLKSAGLLEPFIEKQQLDQSRLAMIIDRVEIVKFYDPTTAMRIIRATEQSINSDDRLSQMKFLRLKEDQYRHLGNYQESIHYHQKVESFLHEHSEIDCYDHQVDAASSLASSYYDAHQFQQGLDTLVPWVERIQADPLICTPEHRVYVWNTYARLMIMTGDGAWREYFEKSLRLQEQVDSDSIPRTRNYLIYGLLKHNEWDVAKDLIEQNTSEKSLDFFSQGYVDFYRAELDRCLDKMPPDCGNLAESIKFRLDGKKGGFPNYVDAFRLQALARQADRIRSEKAELMALAGEIFVSEARGQQENIINLFAQCCMFAEACFRDDSQSIEDAGASILQYLEQYPAYHQHYREQVDQCIADPCAENIDALFERTPYM